MRSYTFHRQYFILSREQQKKNFRRLRADSRFRTQPLADGWTLYWQDDLELYCSPSGRILLLGLAWDCRTADVTPQQQIKDIDERIQGAQQEAVQERCQRLMEASAAWCGRWLLITDSTLIADADNLVGVFYADGAISGNCRLLAHGLRLQGKCWRPDGETRWLMGPLTPYPEIRRLLPSQIYELNTGTCLPRQLFCPVDEEAIRERGITQVFTDTFCTSLHNMQSCMPDRRLLIALTGGHDSRALLACAVRAGVDVSCYTLEHRGITREDRTVPARLCERLGIDYTYLRPGDVADDGRGQERLRDYRRFTSGLPNDGDRFFYAQGLYQELIRRYGGRTALLRSGLWEFSRASYRNFVQGTFVRENVYDHYYAHSGLIHDSLEAYFDWCEANPQPGLDDGDRFSWDQVGGSWMQNIDGGFDLLEGTVPLEPYNSQLLMTLSMYFPERDRISKQYIRDIVRLACPQIADLPYDGELRDPRRTIDTALSTTARAIERVQKIGLRRTARMYLHTLQAKYRDRKR